MQGNTLFPKALHRLLAFTAVLCLGLQALADTDVGGTDVPTIDFGFDDHVRTSEVVQFMNETLVDLNWEPTAGGGLLLTIDNNLWDDYERGAQHQKDLKKRNADANRLQNVPRDSISKRWVSVRGFHGRHAEGQCYDSGSWFDTPSAVHIAGRDGCASFNYGVTAGKTQVWQSGLYKNIRGHDARIVVKFRNVGYITGWGVSQCWDAARTIGERCSGDLFDTRGGYVNVHLNDVASQYDGPLSLTYTVDPTTLNCNC